MSIRAQDLLLSLQSAITPSGTRGITGHAEGQTQVGCVHFRCLFHYTIPRPLKDYLNCETPCTVHLFDAFDALS